MRGRWASFVMRSSRRSAKAPGGSRLSGAAERSALADGMPGGHVTHPPYRYDCALWDARDDAVLIAGTGQHGLPAA